MAPLPRWARRATPPSSTKGLTAQSAQQLFDAAIKEVFGPALREAGMRGSGRSFYLPSDSHFALLGFQKSQSSDANDVKFTANLKDVRKDVWEEVRKTRTHLPAKPTATSHYGTFEWWERIGFYLPGGNDQWWHLRADGTTPPPCSRFETPSS